MTKEFNNQRRGDQRPDSRDSFLRRFRLSPLARLGLKRGIVDRTWKKGEGQNPADYHTHSESNIHQPPDNRRPRNWREGFFKKETDATTQGSDAKQVKTRIPSTSREHFAIITPKGLAIENKTDGSGELKYIYTGKIPVKDVKWSPGKQKSLAYLLANGDVNVYNLPKDTTIPLSGHTAPVTALAWSPDGTRIASGSDDTTVQVWDATDGRNVVTYPEHTAPVTALAWLPDGTGIASISSDRIMRMWNAISKEPISTDNAIEKTLLVWSPDGKYVATAELENTVRVTERETGHEFRYRGHTALVTALAWSPDGKYIASGSDDNTVRVWQVPPPD